MSFGSTLRPPSTTTREERINLLLREGYFPLKELPRESILWVPNKTGPALSVQGALSKVPSGTTGCFEVHQKAATGSTTCPWGPAVYVVLWRKRQRQGIGAMKRFLEDLNRVKQSPEDQLGLLMSFVLVGLQDSPDEFVLRIAIDNSVALLSKKEQESAK